jgi:hypothetical protein
MQAAGPRDRPGQARLPLPAHPPPPAWRAGQGAEGEGTWKGKKPVKREELVLLRQGEACFPMVPTVAAAEGVKDTSRGQRPRRQGPTASLRSRQSVTAVTARQRAGEPPRSRITRMEPSFTRQSAKNCEKNS